MATNQSSNLLPCPFCGGEAAYIQILGNYGRPHEVYCFTCDGGITEGRSKDGVIHNWNTRPIEDALRKRIAELESAQRWIPVSERLPEEDETCLVISDKSVVMATYFVKEHRWEYLWWTQSTLLDVTHWMPLPQPPEVQA